MPQPRFPDAPGRDIPAARRRTVEDRDGNACVYCGSTELLSIDHILPWSQGGTHDPHNLVVACRVCNSIAGERVFDEYVQKIAYIHARRAALGETRIARMKVLARAGRRIDQWT